MVSRRFHTTPESNSDRLPRVDSEADLAITADARLDNRGELIASLHLPPDRTWTDGALIRVTTTIPPGENIELAKERLIELTQIADSHLGPYVPHQI